MDTDALYDARIELLDFAIDALGDVPSEAFIADLAEEVTVPDDEVNPALDEGFDALERFAERTADRPADALREDLAGEYTRLFVGPRPLVVPHETHYRDDTKFVGEGLAEVEESYAAVGWEPPEDYPEENDFVAVELGFLRNLVRRQRNGEVEAFGYERVFLDEHLLRWIDDFAADVREETDEDLYLAAAGIAEGLVAFEDELAAQMVS
ncbi:molecular chaperone TorD family protein [Halostella sp. JP-L12]|uniref:TorD/DmsD family molecular chaperone n=1 Tax=Halostella TaxID=1843185 RepID=UPI000EF7BEB6|nr:MULTISPECIES: molecular chaperone TorD family protein [Halostella]NHN48946.1 molecular chaperone TorD family protein [Halostella sp. JP-L12]